MEAPLFDIDIPGMQATVNKFQPGTGLAWATLFPLKYTRKFDIKGLEGDEGIPVAADRVAFNKRSAAYGAAPHGVGAAGRKSAAPPL